jgi:adenosylcobinamide kinase / adenosylcobinamide-phosphate guanylyltransferase
MPLLSPLFLIGGARSGKSALAERLAQDSGREVVVIASAGPASHEDPEMAARISAHRMHRPAHWQTVEEPLALADALHRWAAPQRHLVVDCLTLWLTQLLLTDAQPMPDAGPIAPGPHFAPQRAALLQVLPTLPGHVTLIGNELGQGVVPLGAMNRWFVDENGRLHQAVAEHCAQVLLVVAGCALTLKGPSL